MSEDMPKVVYVMTINDENHNYEGKLHFSVCRKYDTQVPYTRLTDDDIVMSRKELEGMRVDVDFDDDFTQGLDEGRNALIDEILEKK